MLELTLPWPVGVTTNHLYRRTRGGQVRRSDRANAWYDEVAILAKGQAHNLPASPRLQVTLLLCEPDSRRRDIDNIVKPVIDSVFGALGRDDRDVCELRVVRDAYGLHKGTIVMRIVGL